MLFYPGVIKLIFRLSGQCQRTGQSKWKDKINKSSFVLILIILCKIAKNTLVVHTAKLV